VGILLRRQLRRRGAAGRGDGPRRRWSPPCWPTSNKKYLSTDRAARSRSRRATSPAHPTRGLHGDTLPAVIRAGSPDSRPLSTEQDGGGAGPTGRSFSTRPPLLAGPDRPVWPGATQFRIERSIHILKCQTALHFRRSIATPSPTRWNFDNRVCSREPSNLALSVHALAEPLSRGLGGFHARSRHRPRRHFQSPHHLARVRAVGRDVVRQRAHQAQADHVPRSGAQGRRPVPRRPRARIQSGFDPRGAGSRQ